jgi:site-specific DNA-methyltransferase (adenine-specific)
MVHIGIQKPLLLEPNQVPKGIYFEIYCSDSKETIKSVQSYFNCKLIRLLFYINAMSTYMEESNFDKIPDPGKFDHEFTDKELYDKYDLTQKEINIIESVIKERK